MPRSIAAFTDLPTGAVIVLRSSAIVLVAALISRHRTFGFPSR
jgi:hypothetical protein